MRAETKVRVRTELKRFLVMFAYLLLIFTLFQLHEYVVLRQHGIPYTRFGFGVIKALVLAKVMLIGDEVKLGKRLSAQPLVYSIVGKSALFTILFIGFDFLEQVLRALFKGKELLPSISAPGGSLAGSLIVALIICVMLIPYFAFREIGRIFGIASITRLLVSREKREAAFNRQAVAGGN